MSNSYILRYFDPALNIPVVTEATPHEAQTAWADRIRAKVKPADPATRALGRIEAIDQRLAKVAEIIRENTQDDRIVTEDDGEID